jgi:hypothetical protein
MSFPACRRVRRAPLEVMSSGPCARPANRLVHGVRGGGVQGCDGGLGGVAVALDVQHAVASLLAEVLDVGAHGL